MGLTRADRDLPALAVLGLLRGGPRHIYDMHRFVADTRKDFVPGVPRSLYHAVDRLARDGLVDTAGAERPGSGPERTLYALTTAGEAALRNRLQHLLTEPDPDATLLIAALSFAGVMAPTEVAAALRARVVALNGRLEETSAEHTGVADRLPRFLLIENEFDQVRIQAERDWVERLVADLQSGYLTWPDQPRWKPGSESTTQ